MLQTWTHISHVLPPSPPAACGRHRGVQSRRDKAPGSTCSHRGRVRLTPAKPENSICVAFSPTFGVIRLNSVSPHVLTIVALICLLLITYKLYHSFLICSFQTIYSNPFPYCVIAVFIIWIHSFVKYIFCWNTFC